MRVVHDSWRGVAKGERAANAECLLNLSEDPGEPREGLDVLTGRESAKGAAEQRAMGNDVVSGAGMDDADGARADTTLKREPIYYLTAVGGVLASASDPSTIGTYVWSRR
ncbi:MAG: hypothetical protein WA786_06920 [Acidimicrobiales bacterium]